jgi:hypothetical protein
MVPKKCLLLVSVALLFAGSAAAQAQGQKTSYRRYTGPLRSVTLDLESGVITRGPVVQDRQGSTVTTFGNNDLGGFVGADTGSCACEWYDAGVKSGGQSTFVSGFAFTYCSAALDVASSGNGGSAVISFISGYTLGGSGGAPNGTELARLSLSGLPANTAASSFFGGFRCYFITIGFGATFCLPDGPIGYGWKFVDLGSAGPLAATWPYLSCVQSCTGPGGPDGLGMVDMIDQYCPPGTLLSTFSFGTLSTGGGYFTSISMDIREAVSTGALPSALFVTTNSAILFDNGGTIGLGPNIGDGAEPYAVQLGCGAATVTGLYRIDIRPGLVAGGIPTGFGLLAVSGPVLQKFTGSHAQNVVFTPTVPLPKDVTFACLSYTNQGWCQSSPKGILSGALRETIGVP